MGLNKFCSKKVTEICIPIVSECLFFFASSQAHCFPYLSHLNEWFFWLLMLETICKSYWEFGFLLWNHPIILSAFRKNPLFFLLLFLCVCGAVACPQHVEIPGPGIKVAPQQQPESLQWHWVLNLMHHKGIPVLFSLCREFLILTFKGIHILKK